MSTVHAVSSARRPLRVVEIADSRFPISEPFAGGMQSLTWHLIAGLRERGVAVEVFAGPGSDPRLGATILPTGTAVLSDAARRDVSMVPEEWLQAHHAHLQMMLALSRRHDVDVVHNNSLHHLPVAMADALSAPVLTTLHTPPTPWLEPAVQLAPSTAGFVAVSEHTARRVVARGRPARDPQRRRRPALAGRGRWSGPGVGRPDDAREGAAPRARHRARRRAADPAGRPGQRPGLLARRGGAPARRRRRARRSPGAAGPRRAGRRQCPVPGDPDLGRALRPGRRRGAGLRHARAGLRAGRPPRGRRRLLLAAACPAETWPRRRTPYGSRAGLSRAAARHRAVTHCSLDQMVDSYLDLLDGARTVAA